MSRMHETHVGDFTNRHRCVQICRWQRTNDSSICCSQVGTALDLTAAGSTESTPSAMKHELTEEQQGQLNVLYGHLESESKYFDQQPVAGYYPMNVHPDILHAYRINENESVMMPQTSQLRVTSIDKRAAERRMRHAQRERESRMRLTPEQLIEYRKKKAARQRLAIKQLSPVEQALRKEQRARLAREARKKLSPERISVLRAKNAERQRRSVQRLTPEEQDIRKKRHAERQRESRKKLTPEQLTESRKKRAERQREHIRRLSPEQRTLRNQRRAERGQRSKMYSSLQNVSNPMQEMVNPVSVEPEMEKDNLSIQTVESMPTTSDTAALSFPTYFIDPEEFLGERTDIFEKHWYHQQQKD